jgi:hypothetical protein
MDEHEEKEKFILLAVQEIKDHPDWMQDLLWAVQKGLVLHIESLEREASLLGAGFSHMISLSPKTATKHKSNLKFPLQVLKRYYSGAGIEKDIDVLLEE